LVRKENAMKIFHWVPGMDELGASDLIVIADCKEDAIKLALDRLAGSTRSYLGVQLERRLRAEDPTIYDQPVTLFLGALD
jgi:hypothetical protein